MPPSEDRRRHRNLLATLALAAALLAACGGGTSTPDIPPPDDTGGGGGDNPPPPDPPPDPDPIDDPPPDPDPPPPLPDPVVTKLTADGQFGIDPELHPSMPLLAYQDGANRIVLYELDPQTGLFLDNADSPRIVDSGAADTGITFNGPQFGEDRFGWAMFYSKEVDGVIQTWRAEIDETGDVLTEPLTEGPEPHMTSLASGTTALSSIRIINLEGSWAGGGVGTWFDETMPTVQTPFGDPIRGLRRSRADWISDAPDLIVFNFNEGAETGQLGFYNVLTEQTTRITDDEGEKTFAQAWLAPEFGELTVMTMIDREVIAIYRDLGGSFWERVAELPLPADSGGVSFGSPEVFVTDDKSYISLTVQTTPQGTPQEEEDAQVWVIDIDPDPETRFALRCDDGEPPPLSRIDPEFFVSDEGHVFVYYNVRRIGEFPVYVCATGIGADG